MFEVTREFWFSAAHRIEGHPKCGRLHGHNYKVVVAIRSEFLDPAGMVIDFGLLDSTIKPLIDLMDHRYLVSHDNLRQEDPYATIAAKRGDSYMLGYETSTAECIAMSIHEKVWAVFQYSQEDISVTVQETPKSEATYTGG